MRGGGISQQCAPGTRLRLPLFDSALHPSVAHQLCRPLQPVAHASPPAAHTSCSPAIIGRAQYRSRRSRLTRSGASIRTAACTENPPRCQQLYITATISLLTKPRRTNSRNTRCHLHALHPSRINLRWAKRQVQPPRRNHIIQHPQVTQHVRVPSINMSIK